MKNFHCFLLFLFLLLLTFSLLSCSERSALVGTWKTSTSFLGILSESSYEFHEDSTGFRRSGPLDPGTEFTYKPSAATQGIGHESGELTIRASILGVTTTEHYLYELKGDFLTLTSKKGTVITYRKETD